MTHDTCDVVFPITGNALPLDHGYSLFGALARQLPRLHEAACWGIHPVRGIAEPQGLLKLSRSNVAIRVPTSEIGHLLPLTGAQCDVDGHVITLGAPRVWSLRPAAALQARLVVVASVIDVKAPEEEQRQQLHDSVRRKLPHLPLGMDAERIEVAVGRRHVLRIGPARERRRKQGVVVDRDVVVGFQVALTGLPATASLVIQAQGLGGRRHMGCGLFVPAPKVTNP